MSGTVYAFIGGPWDGRQVQIPRDSRNTDKVVRCATSDTLLYPGGIATYELDEDSGTASYKGIEPRWKSFKDEKKALDD